MNAASERSPDPFVLVGSTLGETYLIEGVIGCGAHGVLYSARNLRLSSRCAVKLLTLPSGSRRDALLVTLGGCAAAVHPNLTTPYDALPLPNDALLLCSQLLDGEDLANRVALRGKLTPAEGRQLGRQVAGGLLALHRRGLAHGNLTARNVFLLRYDEVAVGNALGDGRGEQAVRLLDMGLGHCDGTGGNSADDQRALALLLLEHIEDLSLQERRVLERAQAALPQVRFPSMQDFWEALASDAPVEPPQIAVTNKGGKRDERGKAASTQTALVHRQKGKASKSSFAESGRETLVVRRQGGGRAADSRGSGFLMLMRSPSVLAGGTLAILLGIGAAVLVERSRTADETPPGEPTTRTAGTMGHKTGPAPNPRLGTAKLSEVSLRFVVLPPDAEVRIGDDKLPSSKVLKVPRQRRALPVVVQAAGHLPYEGEVIPDADRTINIALLRTPPAVLNPPSTPGTTDEPGLGPIPAATGVDPRQEKPPGKRRRRRNRPVKGGASRPARQAAPAPQREPDERNAPQG